MSTSPTLTAQQRAALEALSTTHSTTPTALAEQLGTSPTGAAATAASLVHKGLARRTRYRGPYGTSRPTVAYLRVEVA